MIYRKTKPEETEEEAHNGTNAIGIQTLDKKDPNVLQLENTQKRKRRPRFCPKWRKGGSPKCRPKEIKHCVHRRWLYWPLKTNQTHILFSIKKPQTPNTDYLAVERVCRPLIAIMFIVFNGWVQAAFPYTFKESSYIKDAIVLNTKKCIFKPTNSSLLFYYVLLSCLGRLYWPLLFWDHGQTDKDFDLRSGLAL